MPRLLESFAQAANLWLSLTMYFTTRCLTHFYSFQLYL